ncbi:hypothetical protein [Vibrio coralliilyticus]|uniref:Uncharacterized protein n=1 Tax=Vibrio coralliilyticus TaxID=190893 RepID=A0AAP7DFC6_9VIBR|nr:hypothetical protein [Vibrio coralliilyticus]NOI31995.1 hypothetical protein [Vibrio coralliilyticus]NOJ25196.1 hypothetical protein [Vibrio coralliilyticus]
MEQLAFSLDVDTDTEFNGVWTDEEIILAQEGMLLLALHEIQDGRKSAKMRIEAIEWLMRESDEPFSADICAKNSGYDIRVLREHLRPIIRKYYR